MKRYFIFIFIIVSIFFSYFLINPMAKKTILEDDRYIFYSDYKNRHLPPMFNYMGKGIYHIHPSSSIDSDAVFKFYKPSYIQLHFFLQKGAIHGNILFIIKKNSEIIKKLVVTYKTPKVLNVKVAKNDEIQIIANRNGRTVYDWGGLKVFRVEKHYDLKNMLIPFLWVLLFIFLYTKNHEYLAIHSYILFLLILIAEKLNFGLLLYENVLEYTVFIFSLTFVFLYIYQQFISFKRVKLAFILSFFISFVIYLIPLSFIVYAIYFHKSVSENTLYAIFQTNLEEAYEFLSTYINWKEIAIVILVTYILMILLYKQEKKEKKLVEKSILIFNILLLSTLFLSNINYMRLPNFIVYGFNKYKNELNKFKVMQQRKLSKKIDFNATKEENNETYIVIIGESLNKEYMNLYGYLRDTTPLLNKQKDIIKFNNAYSNYFQTIYALSYALTEANQYNKKNYYDSLSIIDILNRANFDTFWITNQSFYGDFSDLVSVIASGSKHVYSLNYKLGFQNGADNYDIKTVKVLKKELNNKNIKNNRVFFIHLMGSHIKYSNRYPKEFNIFKSLKKYQFGKQYKNEIKNSYDNSILYNDYVVSSIINEAKKIKGVAGVIYFSDHAEDIENGLSHGNKFSYATVNIPMIAWFNNKYKKRYPNRYKNIINNKDKLFSNGFIYDTLIGLLNIKTDHYSIKRDISSKEYSLNEDSALTQHGKVKYTSSKNFLYWQQRNIKYLLKDFKNIKFAPQNIYTLAKWNKCLYSGITTVKLNLKFENNEFYVYSKKEKIDKLSKYLNSANLKKTNTIILSLSNIDKSILDTLNKLSSKFNIKDKIVISTNIQSNTDIIRELISNNFKVSLTISNKEEINVLNSNYLQKNIYLTIPENLYNDVKNKNIKLIIKSNLAFRDLKLIEKLKSKAYIKDLNTKYILLKCKSIYE